MFNYLFPIFCFGLVITAIAFLGIIEAARQARADDTTEPATPTRNGAASPAPARRSHSPRFTAPGVNE
jgi:hypothetical protein